MLLENGSAEAVEIMTSKRIHVKVYEIEYNIPNRNVYFDISFTFYGTFQITKNYYCKDCLITRYRQWYTN